MTIFWRMLLAHLLADFTLQFDIVNRLKRKNMLGMWIHCLTHVVVSLALTWNHLSETWFSAWGTTVNGWGAIALMFAVHYGIDELRIYSMKRGYRDNTASFLTDQAAHVYLLFMICPVSMGASASMTGEKWAAIASLLVLITHFTTVLIYFLEKDIFGKSFPDFDEKYFLIFERLVVWAFFFASGYWWVPFAALWIVQLLYIKRKRIMDLSGLNVWVSVAMSVAMGLCTRYVYYGSL